MRVTIVVAPFTRSNWPSLGAEQVATIIRTAGHEARVIYATLLGLTDMFFEEDPGAPALFTPIYYSSLSFRDAAVGLVSRLTSDQGKSTSMGMEVPEGTSSDLIRRYLHGMRQAEQMTNEAVDEILCGPWPDVIGFSVSNDHQKMPSAAVAKKIKESGFTGCVFAGGSALDGEMGVEFLRLFTEFDAVLRGEVEDTLPDFLNQVNSGYGMFSKIPGACYRDVEGNLQVEPTGIVSGKFTELPSPDYSSFIEQMLRRPPARADEGITLMAETSRSCWWGEKHQCLFCGVDSKTRPFRQKDAEAAVADLVQLWDQYRPSKIILTDSILPRRDMEQYLHRLYEENMTRNWQLFYEVKSTLRRRDLARLRCAGVAQVQAGIESFSTNTLVRMNKGATGLQQVNFLKWAKAYQIHVGYPLLVGTPGESASDLKLQAEILGLISHLEPPTRVNRLCLLRGSPYFDSPGQFSLSNVRPFDISEWTYQATCDQVARLEGELDYHSEEWCADEYQEALRNLKITVDRLHRRINPEMFYYCANNEAWVVTRSDSKGAMTIAVVSDPVELAILRVCEDIGTRSTLVKKAGFDMNSVDTAIDKLSRRGLLLIEGQRMLTLPIPASVNAESDADWFADPWESDKRSQLSDDNICQRRILDGV
ncbi:MAG: RiPP maturation radical SAM C-methyltransferase [Propionibacteriaceae bacterium]|jgi:ribosomal peptide maturation radical SAM protein 1|nr:RiPP maturation radical SAM C-methyltransferase [Propionibacteriaceae bacterium]